MHRYLILLLLLLLPGCSQPQHTKEKNQQAIRNSLADFEGTARIYCCMNVEGKEIILSAGTGFFVQHRDNRYLVTAKHVIRNTESYLRYDSIKVVLSDNRIVEFVPDSFKDSEYGYDVSAARIDEVRNYKAFTISNSEDDPDRFGKYVVMGYMGGSAPTMFYGSGYGYSYHDRKSYIVTDHRINRGVSGSPLLDHKNEVIGIASLYVSGTMNNRRVFNGSFYVPATYLRQLLESY